MEIFIDCFNSTSTCKNWTSSGGLSRDARAHGSTGILEPGPHGPRWTVAGKGCEVHWSGHESVLYFNILDN